MGGTVTARLPSGGEAGPLRTLGSVCCKASSIHGGREELTR